MENRFTKAIRIYKKTTPYIRDILKAINEEYNKLSDGSKIIWDCADIYNDEFIMPMYIYGKAIDPEEYDIFCEELALNLKEQEFI